MLSKWLAFQTARTIKHPSEGPTWLNLVNDSYGTILLPPPASQDVSIPLWRAEMMMSSYLLARSSGAPLLLVFRGVHVVASAPARRSAPGHYSLAFAPHGRMLRRELLVRQLLRVDSPAAALR